MCEPYYDCYRAMIQFAGRRTAPGDPARAGLPARRRRARAAVTDRTKLLLLNTPHNPTGHVFDRAELEAVADVAAAHDLVVVTDEVYEHLTFDDHEHVPLRTLPGMFERTVTISSSGKTFSFTGWKIGWATGPADLVARGGGRQELAVVLARAPPSSRPSRTRSTRRRAFHEQLREDLQKKRDLLVRGARLAGPRRSTSRRAPTS